MERSGDSICIASPMNKSERRKASKHEDEVDLISNLPDPILVLILSGLPSTEELIRTSILSRRWRYLWASVPSLDLKCRRERKRNFKEFVYWVLLNRSVDLVSFRLSCSKYFSMLTVERWIHATVMRNVKQLNLEYSSKRKSENMVLPHCLVTCASLEVLRLTLSGRRLILPTFSRYPALRVLQFTNLELFDDDLVKKFLESCPLLEDLTFMDCRVDKLDLLCISCPKLKELTFYFWGHNKLCGCLKLSCPELVYLKFNGVVASNYIFERLYSLKEAEIDPDSPDIDNLFHPISQLFHGVSHVESLSTDLSFLYEFINATHDVALPNLKNLELTTMNEETVKEYLIQILKCCPELESLELSIENDRTYNPKDYDATEYPTGRILPPNVRWIEFFEFNGEKPKLDICWCDNGLYGEDFIDRRWLCMFAEWGNAAK